VEQRATTVLLDLRVTAREEPGHVAEFALVDHDWDDERPPGWFGVSWSHRANLMMGSSTGVRLRTAIHAHLDTTVAASATIALAEIDARAQSITLRARNTNVAGARQSRSHTGDILPSVEGDSESEQENLSGCCGLS